MLVQRFGLNRKRYEEQEDETLQGTRRRTSLRLSLLLLLLLMLMMLLMRWKKWREKKTYCHIYKPILKKKKC